MIEPVGILVGGRSTEHDASVLSYEGLIQDLQRRSQIERVSWVAYGDRIGKWRWHEARGIPPGFEELAHGGQPLTIGAMIDRIRDRSCFTVNLLHGNEGEDGAWQGLAEIADIRGSFGGVKPSSIGMSKWAQSLIAAAIAEVQLPETWRVSYDNLDSDLQCTVNGLGGDKAVVKPNAMGASHLTRLTADSDEEVLREYCQAIHRFDSIALVQRYVPGREFTCGCVERHGEVYVLPVIEAITGNQFLGHDEKHREGLVEARICEATHPIASVVSGISKQLFRTMETYGMARYDFISGNDGGLYFLEVNTIPGLMPGSAFPKMLQSAQHDRVDLLDWLIEAEARSFSPSKLLRYQIDHHGDTRA